MKSSCTRMLAVALLSVGGGAALSAHEGASPLREKREMVVVYDAGDGDRVEIDDLDDLEIGESRTYRTSSGKPVDVTRDEKGYQLEHDGKTLRIGGLLDGAGHGALMLDAQPGAKRKMRRIELDGDGDAQSFVITDDPEHDVLFRAGKEGEHGFAFRHPGAPLLPLGVEGLLERLEASEKFRSLDDATRELVREAIRETAPEAEWIGIRTPGEGAVKIMVRERKAKADEADER